MKVKVVCLHGVVTQAEAPADAGAAGEVAAERINPAGTTIEVTDDLARRLVAIGAARFVDDAQRGLG